MEIYCSENIKRSIEKIINKYDTSTFIFHGFKGVGKRSFANCVCNKILQLNDKSETFDKDKLFLELESEKKIKNLFFNNSHPDAFVLESKEEKNIKIDEIRQLKYFLNETSSISKYKVVIIDSVENLTLNACNTLLKSLEETNINTYVFLISHNLDQVVKTIQSRVFKFYFKPLTENEFVKIMKFKNIEKFNSEELFLIKNLFNYSPGNFLNYYKKSDSLLSDYEIFLKYIKNEKSSKNELEFKKIHLNLRLIFLDNFIKNIFVYFTDQKFIDTAVSFEKDIIKNLNLNSVLIDKIYTEFNIYKALLVDAKTYNSNIDDLLDIFLNKINL